MIFCKTIQYNVLTVMTLTYVVNVPAYSDDVPNNPDQTKHIHAPFVDIDIDKTKTGKHHHHVHVNAPFTNVDRSGPHDVQVNAPFTNVNKPESHDVQVQAPFTTVNNPPGSGNVQVHAPFTKVGPDQPSSAKNTNMPPPAPQRQDSAKAKPDQSKAASPFQ